MKSAVFVLLCQWRKEYFLKEKVAFTEGSKMFAVVLESNKIVFHLSFMLRTKFFSYPSWDSAFFFYQNYNYFYRKLPVVDCIFCCLRMKTPIFLFYVCDWLTALTVAVVPSECLETLVLPTVSLLSDASQSFFYLIIAGRHDVNTF